MFTSRCNYFVARTSQKFFRVSSLSSFSPSQPSTFFHHPIHRTKPLTDNFLSSFLRAFSTNYDNQPPFPHKQIVPPMPPPMPTRIVEPPVRSRPFRPFRSARGAPVVRRTPRRRIVPQNSISLQEGSYPVQAVQVAQSIDMPKVISKVFATKAVRKMMERMSVVVQLPRDDQNDSIRFIAVFRFGSVVFFNVSPRDVSKFVDQIKKCSQNPVLSGNELRESFCIHVQPELVENQNVVTGEYCIVQELNMKSVDVISNVMAQSVALDSYNDTVDELLAQFEIINHQVTETGNLTTVDRDKMFRAVARNNSIFIEMVSKVGIKDRVDTAWNLSQYEEIHDGMKSEFDIDMRFEHIEFKLNLIQQNAKFFLEVLSQQKSNTLEWIIIVLIMFECVLMCMEMSGVGEHFFGSLATLKTSFLN